MSVALKKIEGVDSVAVSLNEGLAKIRLKPGNSVRLDQIRQKVEDNGFTPKEATVVARGQVVSAGGKQQLRLLGTNETYELSVDRQAGKLGEEIKSQAGKTVMVEGVAPPAHPPKGKAERVIQVKAIRPAA